MESLSKITSFPRKRESIALGGRIIVACLALAASVRAADREFSGAGFQRAIRPGRPVCAVLASPPLRAQSAQASAGKSETGSEKAVLELGKPIEAELRGGETRSFKIQAQAGQFIHAVVLQEAIDVVVTLFDPAGKQLAQTDTENGAFGPEPISAIAEVSGDFRLEVGSSDKGVPPGKYEARLTDLRPPTAQDQTRINAERSYMEGELGRQGDANSRREAISKWEASLASWRSLGDKYEEALTLYSIGASCSYLGENQKGLDYYNQALPIQRAIGDAVGEAMTLVGVGAVYGGLGEKQKALDYYHQALPILRAAGNRAGEATTLTEIGLVYSHLGEKQKALDYYNQALPIERAVGDGAGEAMTLSNIGNVYSSLGEKQKALDYYHEVLPIERAAGDRGGEAATLHNIGSVYSDLGEKQKALDYYKQALPLERAVGERAGEATTLSSIGLVYSDLGEKQKALDYYHQALPIRRAVGDRGGEATTFNNIGLVYSDLGEKQKALDYYNQALPIERAVGDRGGEAATLANIGLVYDNLGEKQKALGYYHQALPIRRAVGDHAGEAETLTEIGLVYSGLGEKQKALDYYNQALPLERAAGDRAGEATSLHNIGGVYSALGEKQKAMDYYHQALPLEHAVGDRTGEAATLGNIGSVYSDLGEKQKALDYYHQALPIVRAVGDRGDEARTLHSIGSVYSDLGEKQKALDYYHQALLIERSVGNREGEAWTLTCVGVVYSELGEKQKALDYYNQALPIFRFVGDPLFEAKTLLMLMDYWKDQQRPALAIFFGKQAIDRYQQMRQNITGLEKEAQESFLKSKESDYRELAGLLISEGRLPEAQLTLDFLKVEEYSEFTHRRGLELTGTAPVELTPSEKRSKENGDRIAEEITSIGREWSDLNAKRSRSPDEEARYNQLSDQLTAANQRYQEYLNGLYENFGKGDQANRAVNQIQENAGELQNLSQELGPGTVALYTLVLDQKCVVMVITPSARVAREAQISKTALSAKVFALAGAVAHHQSEESIRSKSQDLYKVLIAPIEGDLEGAQAKTLVWSLDDVLRYVPLAALYDGKQYLAERYQNVVITTASLGNLKDQPQVSRWHGLAMGVSKDYEGLGELKAVPGELNAVVHSEKVAGSHGPVPGTILQDDSFTQANMMNELSQHSPLVHIASHYVFHAGDDTQSYLLLGGKDAGGQAYHLTLANLRDEIRMDFHGVELLTLSGCQTGLGSKDADGREIDGLGITAQRKGAKAVMATLWPVDDASVGLLMEKFYSLWVTTPGRTKIEALREAQLSLLHGTGDSARGGGGSNAGVVSPYSNPYYWAPFILIGNWK